MLISGDYGSIILNDGEIGIDQETMAGTQKYISEKDIGKTGYDGPRH